MFLHLYLINYAEIHLRHAINKKTLKFCLTMDLIAAVAQDVYTKHSFKTKKSIH